MQQRNRGEAIGGSDRATGLAEAGGDPGVASVECGIGPASAIPAFPQTNRPAGFVQGVGPFDVLTQSGKAAGRKIDFNDRKLWVLEFRAERVESIGEQDRPLRTGQGFQRDPAGEGLPVAVVIAPADFEILGPGVIAIGRPGPARDVRSLHGHAGVKRAMIDHVNGPSALTGLRWIERLDRSGAGNAKKEGCGQESVTRQTTGPSFHPDNSSEARRFQRLVG